MLEKNSGVNIIWSLQLSVGHTH